MKKNILYLTLGPALMLALASLSNPAGADVTVTVDVNKTVAIDVQEDIIIRKFITVGVEQTFTVDGTAEADAIANIVNKDSIVDGRDVPGGTTDPDFEMVLNAIIDGDGGSINDNTGVIGVNQDAGNMVNQGNIVVVAGIKDVSAFVDSQAEIDQANTGNTVIDTEGVFFPGNPNDKNIDLTNANAADQLENRKVARILNSINTNSGVVNVNQNVGNMNSQTNAVAFAVGFGSVLALSESALGQTNSGNTVTEIETVKLALISGSIKGNSGIVNVNQSTGNMNNQATALSFSALVAASPITTPDSIVAQ